MKVIMLSGGNSCGKTTTLTIVYQMLLSNSWKSTNKKPLGGNRKDFEDVVNKQNKRVAIFTMGDYSLQVISAMTKYNSQKVDVLVCACNSRFVKPYIEIKKYVPNNIIQKSVTSSKNMEITMNNNDATTIFNLI